MITAKPFTHPHAVIREKPDCTGCHCTYITDLGDHYGVTFITCEQPGQPQVLTVYVLRHTLRAMLEELTPEEFDQVLRDIPSLNKVA